MNAPLIPAPVVTTPSTDAQRLTALLNGAVTSNLDAPTQQALAALNAALLVVPPGGNPASGSAVPNVSPAPAADTGAETEADKLTRLEAEVATAQTAVTEHGNIIEGDHRVQKLRQRLVDLQVDHAPAKLRRT